MVQFDHMGSLVAFVMQAKHFIIALLKNELCLVESGGEFEGSDRKFLKAAGR